MDTLRKPRPHQSWQPSSSASSAPLSAPTFPSLKPLNGSTNPPPPSPSPNADVSSSASCLSHRAAPAAGGSGSETPSRALNGAAHPPSLRRMPSSALNGLMRASVEDVTRKVDAVKALLLDDADSFAQRAETLYQKCPEILALMEEVQGKYEALASRYEQHFLTSSSSDTPTSPLFSASSASTGAPHSKIPSSVATAGKKAGTLNGDGEQGPFASVERAGSGTYSRSVDSNGRTLLGAAMKGTKSVPSLEGCDGRPAGMCVSRGDGMEEGGAGVLGGGRVLWREGSTRAEGGVLQALRDTVNALADALRQVEEEQKSGGRARGDTPEKGKGSRDVVDILSSIPIPLNAEDDQCAGRVVPPPGKQYDRQESVQSLCDVDLEDEGEGMSQALERAGCLLPVLRKAVHAAETWHSELLDKRGAVRRLEQENEVLRLCAPVDSSSLSPTAAYARHAGPRSPTTGVRRGPSPTVQPSPSAVVDPGEESLEDKDALVALEVEVGQLRIRNSDLRTRVTALQEAMMRLREREVAALDECKRLQGLICEEREQARQREREERERERERARRAEREENETAREVEAGQWRIRQMDLQAQVSRLQQQLKDAKVQLKQQQQESRDGSHPGVSQAQNDLSKENQELRTRVKELESQGVGERQGGSPNPKRGVERRDSIGAHSLGLGSVIITTGDGLYYQEGENGCPGVFRMCPKCATEPIDLDEALEHQVRLSERSAPVLTVPGEEGARGSGTPGSRTGGRTTPEKERQRAQEELIRSLQKELEVFRPMGVMNLKLLAKVKALLEEKRAMREELEELAELKRATVKHLSDSLAQAEGERKRLASLLRSNSSTSASLGDLILSPPLARNRRLSTSDLSIPSLTRQGSGDGEGEGEGFMPLIACLFRSRGYQEMFSPRGSEDER